LVKPRGGEIALGGVGLDRLSPAKRARLGLGRTFQQMDLYDSFDVLGNVSLGWETRIVGGSLLREFYATPAQKHETESRAREALQVCDLSPFAERAVGELPTGLRRRVELARVFAGGYKFLLLDEPSSGLNDAETQRFGQLLLDVAFGPAGCGVLLVEHDMALVLEVCSFIYVMDFGKLIFAGTPEEVTASSAVQAAYLGSSNFSAEGMTGPSQETRE
jgi:ABC-type branched-subunit amino acid transport system ATPase component